MNHNIKGLKHTFNSDNKDFDWCDVNHANQFLKFLQEFQCGIKIDAIKLKGL